MKQLMSDFFPECVSALFQPREFLCATNSNALYGRFLLFIYVVDVATIIGLFVWILSRIMFAWIPCNQR